MPAFPAFVRMTAGMTRWACLLQQARPSIENTIETGLFKSRDFAAKCHPERVK